VVEANDRGGRSDGASTACCCQRLTRHYPLLPPAAASVGYLYYRGVRRFPKTFGALGLLGAAALTASAYSIVYQDAMRYGSTMRVALARPRVLSPIARLDKPAPK
jgi:hypothetical protein